MKFKYLLYILMLGCFLLVLPKLQAAHAIGCLTRTVVFDADSTWTGGPITVQCYGDSSPDVQSSNCYGDTVTLSPGETKNLDHCSCDIEPGDAPDGCLHIVSTPNSCNASIVGGDQAACGSNGAHLDTSITGSCQPPPTATPACQSDCNFPEVCEVNGNPTGGVRTCPGVKNSSGNCVYNGDFCPISPDKKECSACVPKSTPTPSPTTGAGTPTVTIRPPTNTPGAGTPTSIPPTPTRVPSATLAPVPTATPTPLPLDLASCKCDGLDATGIFPRANVTFSAFAKVLGTNTSLATVRDITFSVYESPKNQPNTALRIAQSSAIAPQVISQNSSLVRYKSNWNFNYPYKVNTLYRVIAQINCVKKVAMGPASVLAAQTSQPNWIQDIFAGIGRQFDLLIVRPFFGGGSEQSSSAPASNLPAGRQGAAAATPTQTAGQRNALQLQTIQSAQVLEKSCTLIKFTFNNQ